MSKKVYILFVFLLLICGFLSANENHIDRKNSIGAGAYFCNYYPSGKWSEYAQTSIGAGINMEFVLPVETGAFNLGLNLKSEMSSIIPKKNSILLSDTSFAVIPGLFLRIPFEIGKLNAAFVPLLSYGFFIQDVKSSAELKIDGVYIDQMLCFASALNFSIPNIKEVEIQLTPLYMFAFEDSAIIMQFGFQLGFLWYFNIKK